MPTAYSKEFPIHFNDIMLYYERIARNIRIILRELDYDIADTIFCLLCLCERQDLLLGNYYKGFSIRIDFIQKMEGINPYTKYKYIFLLNMIDFLHTTGLYSFEVTRQNTYNAYIKATLTPGIRKYTLYEEKRLLDKIDRVIRGYK